MTSKDLMEERAKLVGQARAILDRAEKENRDTTGDEDSEYKKMMDQVDALGKRVKRLEGLEKCEDDMEESSGRDATDDSDKDGTPDEENEEGGDGDDDNRKRGLWTAKVEKRDRFAVSDPYASNNYRAAFGHWLRRGMEGVPYQYRDAILGTNSQGGYFALPTKLSKQFVQVLDNLCFMRKLATIEQVLEAKSLGVRQITTQPSDASWSGEITQVAADSTMVVNQRALTPNVLTKLITVSIQLTLAASDVEGIVLDRLAYKNAIASEKGFLTGSGSGQPLGVYTASSNGIPTSQDVVSGSSLASLFTADDLINTLYNIPQQYQNSPKFGSIIHRSVLGYVRRLKDSYGQYLWQMGIAQNRPDTLLGFPCYQSEYAPSLNTGSPTASQYVAIFGDFSFYTWAEVVPVAVQRLIERYADLNEIGYLSRYFADGSPTLGAAFSRLQLAAS